MPDTDILLDNLTFPECPRWHGGKLWFSDVHAHKIITVDAGGAANTALAYDGQPAGLGWLPDGALLFVSMVERRLNCVVDGGVGTVADLSKLEEVSLNDMVVDSHGRAYIGAFGFDLNRGAQAAPAKVFLVQPDGATSVAADNMMFPNGMVITPDGRTLIAAETVARRLTAFDIGEDGALSNRRVWAQLEVFPDGICLDAEGAVWVASPFNGECVRVREGGEVAQRIKARANGVYACALGGADGRTLYLCTANTTLPELAEGRSTGWLETIRVDVPAP